jgi:hypothetical protein
MSFCPIIENFRMWHLLAIPNYFQFFILNKWLGITIQTTATPAFFESASSISYSDGIIKLGIIEVSSY